jgi:hypothetical protein
LNKWWNKPLLISPVVTLLDVTVVVFCSCYHTVGPINIQRAYQLGKWSVKCGHTLSVAQLEITIEHVVYSTINAIKTVTENYACTYVIIMMSAGDSQVIATKKKASKKVLDR